MHLKIWKISYIICMGYLLIFSELNAYVIADKNVTPDKFYIQVAAMKERKSVKQLLKKLHRFPLWTYREGELTKIFVVSNPRYKKAMLRKVRRLVPDAFVVKKSKKSRFLGNISNLPYTSEVSQNKKDITLPLNTQTILQTRKKFF